MNARVYKFGEAASHAGAGERLRAVLAGPYLWVIVPAVTPTVL
jgi:hypothetical protein